MIHIIRLTCSRCQFLKYNVLFSQENKYFWDIIYRIFEHFVSILFHMINNMKSNCIKVGNKSCCWCFFLMLLYSCFILNFGPVYVSYISIIAVVVVVLQSSLYSFHILLVSYSKLVLFGNWGFFVYIQGVPYSLPVFSHFIDADSILGQQGIQETLQNMW